MVKEGHGQYLNTIGRIEGGKCKAESAAKTVLLYVQQREGERKGNGVINVDDLDDAAEIHGADSLELFEVEIELILGSIERVSDITQKCQWEKKSICHTFYQYEQKNQKG